MRAIKPDASVGDIAKDLGIRWKSVSNDLRKKYETLALKDKQRYERESTAYKKKSAGTPKKGKKHQESDSD